MYSSRRQYLTLIDNLYSKGCEKNLLLINPKYWPIVRIQLSYMCHLKFGGNEVFYSIPKSEDQFNVKKVFLFGKNFISKWRKRSSLSGALKDKVLLVGFNNHDSPPYGNVYINPVKKMFDELDVESEIFFLRNTFNNKEANKLSEFFYLLISFFERKYYLFEHYRQVPVYKQIATEVKENFGFDGFDLLSIDGACDTIISSLIQRRIYEQAFAEFLRVLEPKLIWTYCFYDNRILSLNLAAYELKIKVVDYQHSIQGDDHFAYRRWENIDCVRQYFPSMFWVWRDVDAEMIKRNFQGGSYIPRVAVGGNILLTLEKSKFSGNVKNLKQRKGILISLQGMWVPDFIEEAVFRNPGFIWYFRLHPRYPNDMVKLRELKSALPDRVEVDKANQLSLYELFQEVSFNLTSFSGTAVEAQAFEVQTVIYNAEGKRAYQEMIDQKAFLFVSNYSQINSILTGETLAENFGFNKIETSANLLLENLKSIVMCIG